VHRLIVAHIFGLTLLAAAPPGFPIPNHPALFFPSDGEDPKLAGGAELLEAVCPGRVVSGEEVACHTPCPTGTSFHGEDMDRTLQRVTRGHFLSPKSDDVVLSIGGCEAHDTNFGGSILLTRRSGHWTMLWYKAGVHTGQCHKVPLADGREILACTGEDGSQGFYLRTLYVEDLLKPSLSLRAAGKGGFFTAWDDTTTCLFWIRESEPDPSHITRSYIERVEFGPPQKNGPPTISITATVGKKVLTPEELHACTESKFSKILDPGLIFFPPMKTYHLEFFFDGHTYKPTPARAVAVKLFATN
jgi:hypothetical protein